MKAKFIVNFETEFESDTVWYKGCGYRTGSATNVVCEASSYGSKRSFLMVPSKPTKFLRDFITVLLDFIMVLVQ